MEFLHFGFWKKLRKWNLKLWKRFFKNYFFELFIGILFLLEFEKSIAFAEPIWYNVYIINISKRCQK
jgi:hypothetical protein